MEKFILIGLALLVLIASSGCVDAIDGVSKGFNETFFPQPEEPDESLDTDAGVDDENVLLPEKVVYLTCKDFDTGCNNRLAEFLAYSNTRAYCVFEILQSEQIANMLINLNEADVDVRVALGKDKTMINCETACIPSSKSQFNNLFRNAVDVAVFTSTENWCINEHGIWIGNYELDKEAQTSTTALIFYNKDISKIYEDRFKEVYQ